MCLAGMCHQGQQDKCPLVTMCLARWDVGTIPKDPTVLRGPWWPQGHSGGGIGVTGERRVRPRGDSPGTGSDKG